MLVTTTAQRIYTLEATVPETALSYALPVVLAAHRVEPSSPSSLLPPDTQVPHPHPITTASLSSIDL